MKDDLLRIGVVTSPHGVHGEVKVYPTTDDLGRFSEIDTVVVENRGKQEVMDVEGVKYFKGMAIVKLSGLNSMDEAEKYRKAELLIHRSQSAPLEPGHYFIVDLIGLKAFRDTGEELGTVTDFLTTGANNVYVIEKTDGKELLVPDIPACIREVDIENGRLTVFVMPGLED